MLIHSGEECNSPAAQEYMGPCQHQKTPKNKTFPVINGEALQDRILRRKKESGSRSGTDLLLDR